jgi:hypothetical protein
MLNVTSVQWVNLSQHISPMKDSIKKNDCVAIPLPMTHAVINISQFEDVSH